ncbi:response regulator [Stappia sp. F7233]|uniref:Response regulator n=1 Tax=Stappia albiluteola TaxID=2758565 RepID=A0A839AJX1_9HYPH|nr:response regulator [Stappia albiluteola]MBA5779366.1 response regulator [Stappia albiluteola]
MPTPMNLSRLSVLVVDDNAHMRTILRTILNSFGIRRIHEASDGQSGMTVTRDQRPDIVLCDWVMAPRDGADFMAALRGDEEPVVAMTPVMMLSADTRKAVVLKALRLGIHEFLAKPVSPALMYERLEYILLENRPFVRKDGYFGPVPRASMPGGPRFVGPGGNGKARQDGPEDEADDGSAVFI